MYKYEKILKSARRPEVLLKEIKVKISLLFPRVRLKYIKVKAYLV